MVLKESVQKVKQFFSTLFLLPFMAYKHLREINQIQWTKQDKINASYILKLLYNLHMDRNKKWTKHFKLLKYLFHKNGTCKTVMKLTML